MGILQSIPAVATAVAAGDAAGTAPGSHEKALNGSTPANNNGKQPAAGTPGGADKGKQPPSGQTKPPEGYEPAGGKPEGEKPDETADTDTGKKFKLQVNGQEMEVGEQEIIRMAQKAVGLDKKLNRALNAEKKAMQLLTLLKTEPMTVLRHPSLGHDVVKMAEAIIMEQVELSKMTPEQRELIEVKRKNETLEEERKRQQTESQHAQFEAAKQHYSQEYERDIISAIESSGLPRMPGTVKRMAFYIAEGLKRGRVLKAADVIDIVRNDYTQEITELLKAQDGDGLLKMLGEDSAKKLRTADLKRVAPQNGARTPTGDELPQGSTRKSREVQNMDDFREKMQRIKEGIE